MFGQVSRHCFLGLIEKPLITYFTPTEGTEWGFSNLVWVRSPLRKVLSTRHMYLHSQVYIQFQGYTDLLKVDPGSPFLISKCILHEKCL